MAGTGKWKQSNRWEGTGKVRVCYVFWPLQKWFLFFKPWVIPYSPPLINKSFFFSCWVSNHFVKMIFQSSHPKRPVYQVQSSSQKRKPDAPYYSEKVFVCMYLSHPREKINLAGHKKNCSYCKKVVAYNFTDVLLFALWITYTLIVYRHFSPLFFSLCVKLYWPPSSVLPNFCLFHSVLTCVNGLNETNFPWKFMNYKIQRAYFSFTFTTTYLGTKRVQVKKENTLTDKNYQTFHCLLTQFT